MESEGARFAAQDSKRKADLLRKRGACAGRRADLLRKRGTCATSRRHLLRKKRDLRRKRPGDLRHSPGLWV